MSTRGSTRATTPAEREKARIDAVIAIETAEDAHKKLEEREFAAADQDYSVKFIATCLQQLTYLVPADPAAIIKSLAIILECIDSDHHATLAAGAIVDKMNEPLTEFIAMAKTARDIVAQLTNAADTISVQLGELAQHTANIGNVMTEIQQASQKASSSLEDQIEHLREIPQAQPPPVPPSAETSNSGLSPNPNPNSYAARTRARAQPPTSHTTVMARNNERARQVLFTKAPGMASQGLDNLTPETLVIKANIALDLVKAAHGNAPKDAKFMGAKQLAKGDILFDLNSTEAATWLRTPNITAFCKKHGSGADFQVKLGNG
jgi:hypothetical protein